MTFLWHGLTDQGVQVPVQVDPQGRVVVASTSEPPGADAWVYCSAAFSNGPATILGSFNVASVTRHGPGDYEITFTSPMPSANYAVTGNCTGSAADANFTHFSDLATTSVRINIRNTTVAPVDAPFSCVVHASDGVT